MSNVRSDKGTIRRSFGKVPDIVPVPNLIEIQSTSFNDFAQLDCLPEERKLMGLEKVLRDVFPIEYEDKMSLEYVSYELGNWACACGKLTGIESRYQWSCSSCKKSKCSRLDERGTCTFCKKQTARYRTCSNCLTRVVVKLPMTLEESRASGQTFSMPLKIKVQLVTWNRDDAGEKQIVDVKEQDIFFADVPVMADLYEDRGQFKVGNLGTFLINGVDRVIVTQLHRSPGAIFTQSKKIKDFRGRPYYLARIIPMRGSWIDFEFDSNDHLYVRIDRKKKFPVTTFLQALGVKRDEILPLFYSFDELTAHDGDFYRTVNDQLIGLRIEKGMLVDVDEKPFVGRRITKSLLAELKRLGVKKFELKASHLVNRVLVSDLIDEETGEILLEQGTSLTQEHLDTIKGMGEVTLKVVQSSGYVFQPIIAMTLAQDKANSEDEALKELYAKVWPGDSATIKEMKERLHNLLFNNRFYDLTRVGRVRMNRKLGLTVAEDVTALTKEDIIESIRYLVNLRERGEGELDDIDHLGNRRVRLVGELLNNQMYMGFLRVERIVRERFRIQEVHGAVMPQDFLNVKPLSAVIREFFGLGQLSQFMDQTNPLAEIAHKRRLSALGPGGVLKDRATYEIRDVHPSHYGRICPIETPEGQTVGLISSLATYAMVNDLGFIETAYLPVKDGKVKEEPVFMDAFQEAEHFIAQAGQDFKKSKKEGQDLIVARNQDDFVYVEKEKVDYRDLAPKQIVSVSTALIPFLEHDDAVRALMGSNMQRQAVPLVKAQTVMVGTGMEKEIAKASGGVIMSRCAGEVVYVSSEKIVVKADAQDFPILEDWISQGVVTYSLKKFLRSSYSTWIHHTPIVQVGDRVSVGDILTDGSAIKNGELALGANLLVAFMPWHGYNFEDAIVLSNQLVSDDVLTSVHIDEYSVEARDTKLGPEEITRDIPNVSETALEGLDEDGIVRIGTRVKQGDILVGKVTLKGDVQYSPEEKLLRAIFGEKSREVRDTSLRVPPGIDGTVIDVKIFSRSGVRKDKRYKDEVAKQVSKLDADHTHHLMALEGMVTEKVVSLLTGQSAKAGSAVGIVKGKFDAKALEVLTLEKLLALKPSSKVLIDELKTLKVSFENQIRILEGLKEEKVNNLKKGDPLPSGVIKLVKIFIAMKRAISVGDKIAGRHGNKGVISNIVPREDMPCLDDGSTVDIVLNPLGVPSRMNVGQILETALGMVGREIGHKLQEFIAEGGYKAVKTYLEKYYGEALIAEYEKTFEKEGVMALGRKTAASGVNFSTPVFDGASFENDIKPLLEEVGLPAEGIFKIRDGRTGEYFDQPVTVGCIYMLKLNHMVDDKLHARSVGPYSLVTQQPLGGKAQQGGQRLGEMEVWALEAHGAAYTLQEMLTYKSDDVNGRHKVYEAIVRSEEVSDPGVPESFNVLIKELQSLGLQVDLFKSGKEKIGE